jgi:shikimate kinase
MGRTLIPGPDVGSLAGVGTGVPFRRVVLVGFMGSGKSTVGPLLAEKLGWTFRDLDAEIERREARGIPAIFREEGETGFRAIEHRVAGDLLHEDDLVLASGGGWPCRPGRLEALPPGTLTIWLRVSPEAVFGRTGADAAMRPLLQVEDPPSRIRELLVEREPYYRGAQWWVDTDLHPPPEIARQVASRLREDPERPLRH